MDELGESRDELEIREEATIVDRRMSMTLFATGVLTGLRADVLTLQSERNGPNHRPGTPEQLRQEGEMAAFGMVLNLINELL